MLAKSHDLVQIHGCWELRFPILWQYLPGTILLWWDVIKKILVDILKSLFCAKQQEEQDVLTEIPLATWEPEIIIFVVNDRTKWALASSLQTGTNDQSIIFFTISQLYIYVYPLYSTIPLFILLESRSIIIYIISTYISDMVNPMIKHPLNQPWQGVILHHPIARVFSLYPHESSSLTLFNDANYSICPTLKCYYFIVMNGALPSGNLT